LFGLAVPPKSKKPAPWHLVNPCRVDWPDWMGGKVGPGLSAPFHRASFIIQIDFRSIPFRRRAMQTIDKVRRAVL